MDGLTGVSGVTPREPARLTPAPRIFEPLPRTLISPSPQFLPMSLQFPSPPIQASRYSRGFFLYGTIEKEREEGPLMPLMMVWLPYWMLLAMMGLLPESRESEKD